MVFKRGNEIVDGIFSKENKNDVWREINNIHNLNKSFIPRKSDDLNSVIISGEVKTFQSPIKVDIVIPKEYLNDPDVYPIIKINTLPEGFLLSNKCDMISADDQTLNIDKIVPGFRDDPDISEVLNEFQRIVKEEGNPIFAKVHMAADVLEAVKPFIDDINDLFTKANEIQESSTLEKNLDSTLDNVTELLATYNDNLEFSFTQYQETVNAQKLTFTPEFEKSLKRFSKLAKYQATKDYLEKMLNDNIISTKEYINGVRDIAALEFEERILPNLF